MKKKSFLGGWQKESLIWAFWGGVLLGILLVNMTKSLYIEEIDFLSTDILYEMKHMSVDYGVFFFGVLRKRVVPVVCIMLLATTYLGVIVSYGYAGWIGLSVGMFVAVAVVHYGVKGLLLFVVALFPHYLLYLPAWMMLLKGARELCSCIYFPGNCKRTYINGRKDEIKFGLGVFLKVLGVVIIGILSESYVNPKLLLGFLKIF